MEGNSEERVKDASSSESPPASAVQTSTELQPKEQRNNTSSNCDVASSDAEPTQGTNSPADATGTPDEVRHLQVVMSSVTVDCNSENVDCEGVAVAENESGRGHHVSQQPQHCHHHQPQYQQQPQQQQHHHHYHHQQHHQSHQQYHHHQHQHHQQEQEQEQDDEMDYIQPCASGAEGEVDGDEDPSNLIINYLPMTLDDAGLEAIFSEYGQLQSAKVVLDKVCRASMGFGFVKFVHAEDAWKAVQHLNRMKIGDKEIRVSIARKSSEQIKRCKLVIMNLPPPKTVSQQYLEDMLGKYGVVIHYRVICRKNGSYMCFVQYATRGEAENALHLHGTMLYGQQLDVSFANPKHRESVGGSGFNSPHSGMCSPPSMSPCTSPAESYRALVQGHPHGFAYGHPGAAQVHGHVVYHGHVQQMQPQQQTHGAPRLGFATAPGSSSSGASVTAAYATVGPSQHPETYVQSPPTSYRQQPGQLQYQQQQANVQYSAPADRDPRQFPPPQEQEQHYDYAPPEHHMQQQQQQQQQQPSQQQPRKHFIVQQQQQQAQQLQQVQQAQQSQQQPQRRRSRANSGASPAQQYASLPQQPPQLPQPPQQQHQQQQHYQQPSQPQHGSGQSVVQQSPPQGTRGVHPNQLQAQPQLQVQQQHPPPSPPAQYSARAGVPAVYIAGMQRSSQQQPQQPHMVSPQQQYTASPQSAYRAPPQQPYAAPPPPQQQQQHQQQQQQQQQHYAQGPSQRQQGPPPVQQYMVSPTQQGTASASPHGTYRASPHQQYSSVPAGGPGAGPGVPAPPQHMMYMVTPPSPSQAGQQQRYQHQVPQQYAQPQQPQSPQQGMQLTSPTESLRQLRHYPTGPAVQYQQQQQLQQRVQTLPRTSNSALPQVQPQMAPQLQAPPKRLQNGPRSQGGGRVTLRSLPVGNASGDVRKMDSGKQVPAATVAAGSDRQMTGGSAVVDSEQDDDRRSGHGTEASRSAAPAQGQSSGTSASNVHVSKTEQAARAGQDADASPVSEQDNSSPS